VPNVLAHRLLLIAALVGCLSVGCAPTLTMDDANQRIATMESSVRAALDGRIVIKSVERTPCLDSTPPTAALLLQSDGSAAFRESVLHALRVAGWSPTDGGLRKSFGSWRADAGYDESASTLYLQAGNDQLC